MKDYLLNLLVAVVVTPLIIPLAILGKLPLKMERKAKAKPKPLAKLHTKARNVLCEEMVDA